MVLLGGCPLEEAAALRMIEEIWCGAIRVHRTET